MIAWKPGGSVFVWHLPIVSEANAVGLEVAKMQARKNTIKKLKWYSLRWKIDVFHKVLKSGSRAEEVKIQGQRLSNLVAVYCIVRWRVFWMTMLKRSSPDAPLGPALTSGAFALVHRLVRGRDQSPSRQRTLSHDLIKTARLGGFLARRNDLPPGNMVMWH